MGMEDLLNSTKPVLYDTGFDEWPYAYSGTCYPVKYRGRLFIVSAFHCYENSKTTPEKTLYPQPSRPSCFFAYDLTTRARSLGSEDKEHYDHVVLQVAGTHHSQEEMDEVVALDLADPTNALPPLSKDIKDIWLRGFPDDAPKHEIDYDKQKISQQAYTTNGYVSVQQAPHDHCYLLEMVTPAPPGMRPNGMSGTPVYGITHKDHPVYCGMITKYNATTREFMLIGAEILVNCLRNL